MSQFDSMPDMTGFAGSYGGGGGGGGSYGGLTGGYAATGQGNGFQVTSPGDASQQGGGSGGGPTIYWPGQAAQQPNPGFNAGGGGMGGGFAPRQQLQNVQMRGGGAPNFGYQNPAFISQFTKGLQSQWQQALTANQNQLKQMQGIAAGYGQGALGYSNQLTQQQGAQGQQQMASRGLYNSTVANGVQQSAQDAGALRNNQINDQTAQMQLGILGQNQIQYPNLGAYASLASQPGAFSGNTGYSQMLGAMSGLNYGGAGSAPSGPTVGGTIAGAKR